MENWWFDLLALALLVCIGVVAIKARRADISVAGNDESFLEASEPRPWWHIYPSKTIRQCGLSPADFRLVYWLAKLTPCLLSLLMFLETPAEWRSPWLLLGSVCLSYFGIDLWLLRRRRQRHQEISRSLPFFVNVLVVYLRSGISLAKAFDQAAEYGLTRENALAREVGLLNLEFAVGRSREEAFSNLAKRTGVKELEHLAAVLSVGFQVGSPVADTLHAQAELMRVKQVQQGNKLVNRKTMEAMLPMSLVCFPMFLVLIFYPAANQIFDVLRLMKDVF